MARSDEPAGLDDQLATLNMQEANGLSATYLAALARELQTWSASGADVWCIFDNTATGAAVANALELARSVATDGPGAP